jgi:VanZ family protein
VTDPSHFMWQKKLLATLSIAMVAGLLIATLWPFDFFRSNQVIWLPGEQGIRFTGPGVVLGKAPLTVGGSESNDSATLEILLRPAGMYFLRTILEFYSPNNPSQLLLRQSEDTLLILHDNVDPHYKVKTGRIRVEHALQPGKLVLIIVASGPDGTTVYSNGVEQQSFPDFKISQSDLTGQIVLGTSPIRYDPWRGEVRGLAIYARKLTLAEIAQDYAGWTVANGAVPEDANGAVVRYAFTEGAGRIIHSAVSSAPDLEIPKRFVVPWKPFLQSPAKHFEATWFYLHDVLVNIAGFIPLGFLLCAWCGWTRKWPQAILFSVLAGGALSFLIEILQGFVPQRDSGLTDVITNTLGVAIGALFARPNLVRSILVKR